MIVVSLEEYFLNLEEEVYSKQISISDFFQSCNIPCKYIYQNYLCIPSNRSWVYWRMVKRYKKQNYKDICNMKEKIKSKSKLCMMNK